MHPHGILSGEIDETRRPATQGADTKTGFRSFLVFRWLHQRGLKTSLVVLRRSSGHSFAASRVQPLLSQNQNVPVPTSAPGVFRGEQRPPPPFDPTRTAPACRLRSFGIAQKTVDRDIQKSWPWGTASPPSSSRGREFLVARNAHEEPIERPGPKTSGQRNCS